MIARAVAALLLFLVGGVAGCGMQPMALPTTDPPGPGLFTGDEGAFVLTRPLPGSRPAGKPSG